MPSILDSFLFEIGWKTDGFKKGEKEIEEGVKKTGATFDRQRKLTEENNKKSMQSFRLLKNEVLGLALAFTGSTSIKGFFESIIKGDAATGRLADNIGVATEKLSAWQGIAKQAGGSAADANSAFTNLNTMYENYRMGLGIPQQRILQRLGISADDLRNPEQALIKLSSSMERMHLSRRDFVALALQLGIPESVITQLAKGKTGIEALLEQQRKLGHATKQSAEEAKAYEDAMASLSTQLTDVFRPAVTGAAQNLADFINKLRDAKALTSGSIGSDVGEGIGDYLRGDWEGGKAAGKRGRKKFYAMFGINVPDGTHEPLASHGGAWTSQQLAAAARAGYFDVTGEDRSTARNRQVGGVANSQHINDRGHPGTAIDISGRRGYTKEQIEGYFARQGAPVMVIQESDHFHVQARRGVARDGTNLAYRGRMANVAHHDNRRSSSAETHIGSITVITNEKDGKGIAATLPDAIRRRNLTSHINAGMNG